MQILVVDDDAFMAMLLDEMLQDLGHAVLGPAHDVAGALRLAAGTSADLALVDIDLAGNQEGIQLARELYATAGIPAIFVSGRVALDASAHDAAFALLSKPFTMDVLARTLQVFQEHAAGAVVAAPPQLLLLRGPVMRGRCS